MKSNYMKENLVDRRTTYVPPSINNSNINEVSLNMDNNPFKHYKSENETGAFVNFASPDQKLNQSGISLTMSNKNNETNQINTEPNVSNKILLNYNKDDAKEKISKIFMAYSKYYKEEKIFLLSQQSLLKILKKLNLIDEIHLKLSDIDILFRKINPHSNKFTEKQFLDFIVKLVGKMYPQEYAENPRNSLNMFISNTFDPFSKYLDDINNKNQEKTDYIGINPLKNIHNLVFKIFDKNVNSLLNSIYFAIKEIYINYFHYENNNYRDKQKVHEGSMKSLIEFFKDFEIFPYLINMDQVVTYYSLITKIDSNSTENFLDYEKEDKEIGYYFTINKFCLMLYHLALVSYSKHSLFDKECKVTDVDKVLLFLEKLENSKGFQNLENVDGMTKLRIPDVLLKEKMRTQSRFDVSIYFYSYYSQRVYQ